MKKTIYTLLTLCLLFSLSACNKAEDPAPTDVNQPPVTTEPTVEPAPEG